VTLHNSKLVLDKLNFQVNNNKYYTMFYTKYRPKKFSEFLGSSLLVSSLQNAIFGKNFAHAYFLYGPRGVGKTTLARLLAKALNCTNPTKDKEPCQNCPNCIACENGSFIDLIEIDAASNRGIDDIRSLRDKVAFSPSTGKYKIYIIDEVHMLTTEAFNALLKTLEEPPAHAVFILCTTEEAKVPETIKSRCQKFELKRAGVLDIVSKLETILKSEKQQGIKIPELIEEDLKKIAKIAKGGFRDAETLLEQVVFGNENSKELLETQGDLIEEFVDSILIEKSLKSSLEILDSAYNKGIPVENFIDKVLEYLQKLLFGKAGSKVDDVDLSKMQKASLPDITLLIKEIINARNQTKYSYIPYLPLQVVITNFIGAPSAPSEKAVVFNPPNTPNKPNRPISIDFSIEKLYEAVRPLNHSVEALLKSCRILGFNENKDTLKIEAFYSFHKERLSSATNRKIVEDALDKIMGKPIAISVTLAPKKELPKEDLSDKNVESLEKGPKKQENIKEAWEVLDGNAPL